MPDWVESETARSLIVSAAIAVFTILLALAIRFVLVPLLHRLTARVRIGAYDVILQGAYFDVWGDLPALCSLRRSSGSDASPTYRCCG